MDWMLRYWNDVMGSYGVDGMGLCTFFLLVLFFPTGTQGLNNFTIVEVSIAVKFFTETGLLALCSNPPTWGVPILVAFYDMHGLQWDYSFPRSPQGEWVSVSGI
jgi:hypothetical protein